ncbi:DUF2167 domain-containing protein [Zavarzinia compransoris]|uniref:DUF2167 domain-containing protein n=1 Tax=Zavarzinia marina TaxID=2911065 RepID=UPI001F48ACDC|nr:DUF2167 domain-containing protein [Zavarzinia marina]MCF4164911.1 DUF2167 domain-containing protein [Zavarzinia marina]
MRRSFTLILPLLALLTFLGAARAQQPEMSDAEFERLFTSLRFIEGDITLRDDLANVSLTPDFQFLGSGDAQTFLTKFWGNPPEASRGVLGLIMPAEPHPLSPDAWAVVISYEAAGYISDGDAADIDYDDLLRDLQEATEDGNPAREKQGYEAIHLLGWARAPHYDPATKKLHWAKRLRFGDAPEETLNYEIRILGRRGYLDLNIVGAMAQFEAIDSQTDTILSMVQFNQGHTYAEFDPEVDETAAYGIAGLIAGGVLAKAGFFKGLIALVIAFKKVFIIGAVALFAGGWQIFKRVFRRGGETGV